MGKKTPKVPQAPDPHVVAQAQAQANIEGARATARLNNVDQHGPYGSMTWTDHGNDRWSSNMTLDPKLKAILDAQLGHGQAMNGVIGTGLSNVQDAISKPLDGQGTADALYSSYTRRLDPQFAEREQQMKSELMNRGFMEGTEAWDREMKRFQMDRTDAYGQATRDSTLAAGQEESRQLAARQSIIQELLALQGGQAATAGAAMGAMPQFNGGSSGVTVGAAPIAQAMQNQYSGQMDAYNAQVGSRNSLMGGLFSLGAGALMGGMGLPFMGAGGAGRVASRVLA